MIDERCLKENIHLVKVDQFNDWRHKMVIKAIIDIYSRGQGVDLITVAYELRQQSNFDEMGSEYYLARLTQVVASTSHITHHILLLNQEATRRRLRSVVVQHHEETSFWEGDIHDIYQKLVTKLSEAVLVISGNRDKLMDATLDTTIKQITKQNTGALVGVPSAIEDLNRITGGYRYGNLYLFAGRPGMGKTVFGINEAMNAVRKGYRTRVVSAEMTAVELTMRMLANESGIKNKMIRNGNLEYVEIDRLKEASERMKQWPLIIDDETINLTEIILNCRADYNTRGLDLIVVDYIQRISHSLKGRTRDEEVGEMAKAFKNLAKELKIPIILLAQLSRRVEDRRSKRPEIADLRESGQLEQEADVIGLLFRPEYYHIEAWPDHTPTYGEADIDIAKNRHGDPEIIRCGFDGGLSKFMDISTKRRTDKEGASNYYEKDEQTF